MASKEIENISYANKWAESIINEEEIQQLLVTMYSKLLARPDNQAATGNTLGNFYCNNSVTGCTNTTSVAAASRAINKLPIFIIVGHSDYRINITSNDGKSYTDIIDPPHSSQTYFYVPVPKVPDITQSKFVVYPTPAACWGLLCEDTTVECDIHVLNSSFINIKQNLFNPSYTFPDRIKMMKRESSYKGERWYDVKESEPLDAGFFIPGSAVLEKGHEFFGETLSGGGFGILRLNGSSYNNAANKITGTDLLKNWTDDDNDNIYYLSNEKLTRNDLRLRNLIKTRSKQEKSVYMSEIVQYGDPGIYITLSCSSLRVLLEKHGEMHLVDVTRDIPRESNFYKLYSDLTSMINTMINPANGEQWDLLCKKLNYNTRVPGGTSDVVASLESRDDSKDQDDVTPYVMLKSHDTHTRRGIAQMSAASTAVLDDLSPVMASVDRDKRTYNRSQKQGGRKRKRKQKRNKTKKGKRKYTKKNNKKKRKSKRNRK